MTAEQRAFHRVRERLSRWLATIESAYGDPASVPGVLITPLSLSPLDVQTLLRGIDDLLKRDAAISRTIADCLTQGGAR